MYTVSLKINNEGNIIKYISIIRKETGKSIGEIKKSIENNYKVIEYDACETDELRRLLSVSIELLANGANVEIYENDRIISVEILKNIINTHEEIEKELEEELEEELKGLDNMDDEE